MVNVGEVFYRGSSSGQANQQRKCHLREVGIPVQQPRPHLPKVGQVRGGFSLPPASSHSQTANSFNLLRDWLRANTAGEKSFILISIFHCIERRRTALTKDSKIRLSRYSKQPD